MEGVRKNLYNGKEVCWMKRIWEFFKREEGASAVEYGLLVALIAAVIIVAVALVGTNLSDVFNTVANTI
jgi:pilus assembly protein Flp/PilA